MALDFDDRTRDSKSERRKVIVRGLLPRTHDVCSFQAMKSFTSFDGVKIAYVDEGSGPAVVLLHGFGVDGLRQSEASTGFFLCFKVVSGCLRFLAKLRLFLPRP